MDRKVWRGWLSPRVFVDVRGRIDKVLSVRIRIFRARRESGPVLLADTSQLLVVDEIADEAARRWCCAACSWAPTRRRCGRAWHGDQERR